MGLEKKENNNLVSIIVPIYNVEQYLARCIESLLRQTYENIEIILVNDGSTDRSLEICEEFKQKDSRVQVIHKANGGLSSARNVGIETAKGDFLTFIDSDDFINERYVEILMQNASQDGLSIIQLQTFFEDETDVGRRVDPNLVSFQKYDRRKMLELFLTDNVYVSACGKMFPSKAFAEIRFPEGRIYEDFATLYKVYNLCDTFFVSDIALYYYFMRRNSITKKTFTNKNLDILIVYKEIEQFIRENDLGYLDNRFMDRKIRNYVTVFYKMKSAGAEDAYKPAFEEVRRYLKSLKWRPVLAKGVALKTRLLYVLYRVAPGLLVKVIVGLKKE